MTAISLEALGLTEQKVLDAIVEATVSRMCASVGYDEEGEDFIEDSRVVTKFNDIVKKMIDAKVQALGDEHVMPLVKSKLETLVLQQTNSWGEAQGKPFTFAEYLIHRAENYMTEKVDWNGRTEAECRARSDSFRPHSTRLVTLMERHLQSAIDSAMKAVLANANATLTKSIADAAKIALAKVQADLKVEVKV